MVDLMVDETPKMRCHNSGLVRRQYRLRHLCSISARNITVAGLKSSASLSEVTQLHVFLTLHQNAASPAFYKGDDIKGSLSPTWPILGLINMDEDIVNTASSSFVARVWHNWHGKPQLCIEWHVELAALDYLGSKMPREGRRRASNSLVFGMFDGFYGVRLPGDLQPPEEPSLSSTPDAPLPTRNSYSVQTLFRIQTIVRAIKQTQCSVKRVRHSISDKLAYSDTLQDKLSTKELLLTHIQVMSADVARRLQLLEAERQAVQQLYNSTQQMDISLRKRFDQLQKCKERLDSNKRMYFEHREELVKSGAQLVMRRKQLISELALIYPVLQNKTEDYFISGVKLPNSEDFAGEDDEMIGVALGYTNHLVQKIGQFLNVPLRYPMEHQGSRSHVHDYIIDKLTEKERDFPLYSKGKERFQFNYGVYLLNKNIAQLRYYCGLGTNDLRLTLPNLNSLLELRLTVKPGLTREKTPLSSVSSDAARIRVTPQRKAAVSNVSSADAPVGQPVSAAAPRRAAEGGVGGAGGVAVVGGAGVGVLDESDRGEAASESLDEALTSDSSDMFQSSPDSFFTVRGASDTAAVNGRRSPAVTSVVTPADAVDAVDVEPGSRIGARTEALSAQCSSFQLRRATEQGTQQDRQTDDTTAAHVKHDDTDNGVCL